MTAITQILLLPHTHHDVGYTNSPRLLAEQHIDVVERVVELADTSATAEPDAFRWSFEVLAPIVGFVERHGRDGVDALRRLGEEGLISLSGTWLNMTQLQSEREFGYVVEQIERLRSLGLRIEAQQHGDINGLSWGHVTALTAADISFLLLALNPDHGRPPLAQPSAFVWEGPSGEQLPVLLSTHYGIGEEWGIIDGDLDGATRRIDEFIAELERRDDWPFSTAIVHAGNDNRWPDDGFTALVGHWNATRPTTRMRTATLDDVAHSLKTEIPPESWPRLRGEWADWWSHGHGSTAREVAAHRESKRLLAGAEHLAAMDLLRGEGAAHTSKVLGWHRGPHRLRTPAQLTETREAVLRDHLLYAEHTWGSWDSFTDPNGPNSLSQRNAKDSFAWRGYELARSLRTEALFRATAHRELPASAPEAGHDITLPSDESATVLNPSAHTRSGIVEVGTKGQIVYSGEIPAFGAAEVPLPRETVTDDQSSARTRSGGITVDADGGIVSWRVGDTELVQPGTGLLSVCLEELPVDNRHPFPSEPRRFRPEDPGPAFTRRLLPGTHAVQRRRSGELTELTWQVGDGEHLATCSVWTHPATDELYCEIRFERPWNGDPHSIHVLFPFEIRSPEFLAETQGAVFTAGVEQLPDTSLDWHSIQHALGVRDSRDGAGVTVCCLDAPLVQLGGIRTGEWNRAWNPAGGLVSSWLMNNLHFTNFQRNQGGEVRFRYRLSPGSPTHASVALAGQETAHPLIAHALQDTSWPATSPISPVSVPDEVGIALRPSADWSHAVAVLRNHSAQQREVVLRTEEPLPPVTLAPGETVELPLPRTS